MMRIAICTAMLGAICGCATTIVPPRDPVDPVAVFVADYGRHSSLLLPTRDGALVEYAFGDYDFFALEHWRWWDMIRVVFYSHESTLGRRYLFFPRDAAVLRYEMNVPNVQRIIVSRARVEVLVQKLDERFHDGYSTILYGPTTGLWFVKDPRSYTIFSNCNRQTADWLRELGCEVKGAAITSDFRVLRSVESPQDMRSSPARRPVTPMIARCRPHERRTCAAG